LLFFNGSSLGEGARSSARATQELSPRWNLCQHKCIPRLRPGQRSCSRRESERTSTPRQVMPVDFDMETIGRAYGRWAPVYDLVFGPIFDVGRRATIAAAERVGGRILDVGVGTGISLGGYSSALRIVGVDYSEVMLRRARERVRQHKHAHVEALAVMDAQHLGFPDSSFDAVVAQYVLTAVPDPEGTLDEFARVVRPGGEIILVNHLSSEGGIQRAIEERLAQMVQRLGWCLDFDWPRLESWIERQPNVRLIERRPMPPFGQFAMVRLERSVCDPACVSRFATLRAKR
jgi:phosphatidylethanolamine/phosphatidyl-N-methylethanolamine N-methyltransferase